MRHKLQLLPLALIVYVVAFCNGCSTLTAQTGSLKQSLKSNHKTSTFVISTTSLANGTANVSYAATLTATGGTTPYIWKLTTGQLPVGITLSSSGVLSGIPTSGGSSTFSVQAADANTPAARTSATLTLTIAGTTGSTAKPLVIQTSSIPGATTGSAYSTILVASGGTTPYSWSVANGQLPTGLSLSANGMISGTPATSGTYSFTVQAVDSTSTVQKATMALTIAVAAAPPATPTLSINTNSLAGATVNSPYSASLSASGGTSPYTWTISAGQLPTGLSLNSSGSISGTPSASGTFSFTVQAADSSSTVQKATRAFSIAVSAAAAAPLVITTSSLPSGTVSSGYNASLAASGGTSPLQWSLSSGQLPAGLTLSSTGAIVGTPTAAGSFTFTVQSKDGSTPQQTASKSLSITIGSSSSYGAGSTTGLLSGSTPASYTVPTGWTLYAKENFESGACASGTWCSGNFVTSQYHNDTVSTHTHALGCTYGNPNNDCSGLNWNKFLPVGTREVYVSFYEWLDTSFRMNDEMFLMRFHWDTGNGQPTFREAILDYFQNSTGTYNSSDATLLWNIQGQPYYQNKLPGNYAGDQTNWNIATGRWVQHEMYVKFSTASPAVAVPGTVTLNATAQTYTCSTCDWNALGVRVGDAVHFTGFSNGANNGDGSAGGGGYSYFVQSMTSSVLTMSSMPYANSQGPVSGVTLQVDHGDGAYSYYKDGVRVAYQTNMVNPGKVDFASSNTTLSLMESYSKLIWHAPVNGSCETKAPFTGTCSTKIGNGTCGYQYVPYGWNSQGYTRSVAGGSFDTPITCSTAAGGPMPNPPVFNRYLDDVIVLTRADGAASAIASAPLAIATTSLNNATVNSSYTASLSATGGTSPYSWSVTSGQLPAGLTITSAGTISGTPTTAGTYNFTVQAVDSSSPQQKATASMSLTVGAATTSALAISTSSLPSGTVNSTYSAVLAAQGGKSPYSWRVSGGQLPPGLSMNSSGQISGMPSASSNYSVTAMVTDQSGQSSTQNFLLDISPAPPSNGIQPMSMTTSSDSYSHYWSIDFPGYAGFKLGDGAGSLLCPNGNNGCQGLMGFWDLKNDPSKQYNYGAFDTGMFEHQWNDILNANGTGRGGSSSNEYKEAGGADQTFTVVEQNNVRVKIVQSGPMHPYGDRAYPADPNLKMTKTYIFYRNGTPSATAGGKVFTTTTLNYDGLDGNGPLNLQHVWGYSKMAWGRVSGEPLLHNDLGCGQFTTLTPSPWQVIYQAPGDYRYKDWQLLAPAAPNGGTGEQITGLSCATPNGPTPGHIYKCNSPSANGCGSTSDLGAIVKTNFLQIEREAQGSYMPLGSASSAIYFNGGLRYNWNLPSRTLAGGTAQTWQSVGFIGDNGITTEAVANSYSTEYKAPPTVNMTSGSGGSFDATEGYWRMSSTNNVLAFSATGDLHSPAIIVSSWTGSAPSTIRVGGSTMSLDVDYVATASNNTLLIQILRTVPSGTLIQIP